MKDYLYVILLFEAHIIVLFAAAFYALCIWQWVDNKLRPSYPFCDINPRCHVAFSFDKHGNGFIGECLVTQSKRG